MDLQLGVLPEMDWEAPGLFTASERIIQDFASEKKVGATFIKGLIRKVLHTFNHQATPRGETRQ